MPCKPVAQVVPARAPSEPSRGRGLDERAEPPPAPRPRGPSATGLGREHTLSYHLTFRRPRGQPPLSPEQVQAYFDAHPRYQVGNREAVYRNESTGVAFAFRWGREPAEEAALEDEGAPSPDEPRALTAEGTVPGALPLAEDAPSVSIDPLAVSTANTEIAENTQDEEVRFELAHFRPRTFALEAALELDAFVARFEVIVDDPQKGGLGSGRYLRSGFLRGWDAGNRRAYQGLAERPAAALATLPLAEQERCWRWNLGREVLQEELGHGLLVPMIIFVAWDRAVRPAVLWTDAIPFVLPEVELVVLHRALLSRRRFFLFKTQSLAIVPYEAVIGALGGVTRSEPPRPYQVVQTRTRPLVELFRTAPAHPAQLEVVSPYQVLDRETVESARAVAKKKR